MMQLNSEEEKRAIELHKKSIVLEAHSDIGWSDVTPRRIKGEKKVLEKRHIPKMIAGGVNTSIVTVWCDSGWVAKSIGSVDHPTLATLKSMDLIRQDINESKNIVTQVKTIEDIKNAKRDGKIGLLFHLEGGKPIADNLCYLRVLYDLGIRSAGLVWSGRNNISDGIRERSKSGLSNFGVEVVNEMNKLGIVIDVSHLNTVAFFDVLEFSSAPIVASHSNSKSLCDHRRNLTDEQIKALTEKGGVMGMCSMPSFINKKEPTLEKWLDHVDYISELVGVEYIGLGPDFMDYMGDTPFNAIPGPQDLENVSKLTNFTRGLVSRGYSDGEIEGILGGNFLKVYEKVFKFHQNF